MAPRRRPHSRRVARVKGSEGEMAKMEWLRVEGDPV